MSGSETEPALDPVISDSGPLIALAAIGRLEWLRALFGQVIIPQAVYDEVVVHGQGEPGCEEVHEAEWIAVRQTKDRLAVSLLREALDAFVDSQRAGNWWGVAAPRHGPSMCERAATALRRISFRLTVTMLVLHSLAGLIFPATRARRISLNPCELDSVCVHNVVNGLN